METSNWKLSHEDFKIILWVKYLEIKIFYFKSMLSHDLILKSIDTEKWMTQLLSFNRKVTPRILESLQTSVFRKLYRKVKIKGKRETWSKLENLIFQIISKTKEIKLGVPK